MKYYFFTFFILVFTFQFSAQQVQLRLEAESTNRVRLRFLISEWSEKMDGLVVQRKVDSGSWKKISGLIRPSIGGEDLSTRCLDPQFQSEMQIVIDRKIASKNGQIADYETFRKEILLQTDRLKMVNFSTIFDYTEAVAMGFGYLDHAVPSTVGTYTYGVFVQEKGQLLEQPLDQLKWKYGELCQELEFNSQSIKKKLSRKKGVELVWLIDKEWVIENELTNYDVVLTDSLGNDSLITPQPVVLNMSENPIKLSIMDIDLDLTKKWTFSVRVHNTLSLPKIKMSVDVGPEDFPIFPKPTLEVSHLRDSDPQVSIKWGFPNEFTKFIQKIELRKGESPTKLTPESMSKTINQFYDGPYSRNGAYYYQLRIVTTTGDVLFSDVTSVTKYFPLIPPKPLDLRASYLDEYVTLNWRSDPLDEVTLDYRVFVKKQGDEKWYQLNLKEIKTDSIRVHAGSASGHVYTYAICGVSKDVQYSQLSDQVSVLLPSRYLPRVQVNKFSKDKNTVILNWEYPDYILDVAGFRLYQNGVMVVDESIIDPANRSWRIENLEKKKYNYQLQAVNTNGTESELSTARTFNITELK